MGRKEKSALEFLRTKVWVNSCKSVFCKKNHHKKATAYSLAENASAELRRDRKERPIRGGVNKKGKRFDIKQFERYFKGISCPTPASRELLDIVWPGTRKYYEIGPACYPQNISLYDTEFNAEYSKIHIPLWVGIDGSDKEIINVWGKIKRLSWNWFYPWYLFEDAEDPSVYVDETFCLIREEGEELESIKELSSACLKKGQCVVDYYFEDNNGCVEECIDVGSTCKFLWEPDSHVFSSPVTLASYFYNLINDVRACCKISSLLCLAAKLSYCRLLRDSECVLDEKYFDFELLKKELSPYSISLADVAFVCSQQGIHLCDSEGFSYEPVTREREYSEERREYSDAMDALDEYHKGLQSWKTTHCGRSKQGV